MEIFGGLIEFKDKKEFIEFMDNIDEGNAVKLIETSMNYAIKSGLFDFDESYAMYKCLLKLKSYENNADSNLPVDDSNRVSDSI
jgi:hypothetical protein